RPPRQPAGAQNGDGVRVNLPAAPSSGEDRLADALPGVLGEIAAVAGEDAALSIAAARGGTQVYIPHEPGPHHWLTHLVCREAAQRIADRLTCGVGGLRLDLPLGPA